MFTVYFEDPYSFIKNGYQPIEGTYERARGVIDYPQPIFRAKLSEVNFAERPFMGREWYCHLDAVPEETGNYTFSVKVTFVVGTVLEGTAPPINIKGSKE